MRRPRLPVTAQGPDLPPAEARVSVPVGSARPTLPSPRKVKRTPELEITLGARIRATRIAARMNQTELGQAVGISFQQLQKYEKGKDRVAASTLQGLAAALGVHPGSFFDDVPMLAGSTPDIREVMGAAAALQRMRSPKLRKRIMALVATLVDADEIPG